MTTLVGTCHCGAVRWRFNGAPDGATACNCTICRRYGTLWIYGHEGEEIEVTGETRAYLRDDSEEYLAFNFCPRCGCMAFWRGEHLNRDGRRRMAVNVRLAEPDTVAALPIDHFDGLSSFEDLPRDGRCVIDYWF
ncbi:MAG: GFA family protein [Aquamicrobium sp.]|uniref:GFA family protein n=1 Tax=Mesorhizobium sp. Pch-S TaxID=2082387 RepID=UPI0010138146|nr:GFA family protein [Mesorhizobium sp. Pch-S]MBR2688800.1 GFA family protein [Aquamicrobium sp.]QAZ45742.1 aldehyde-activating protein [Mesorhizobium sp. Pch-S]